MATQPKRYSHITFEMRATIENRVVEGRTIAHMARELGIDATSVSRELKRNKRCTSCALRCRRGGCPEFEEEVCARTHRCV